jgi:hypothetical protein
MPLRGGPLEIRGGRHISPPKNVQRKLTGRTIPAANNSDRASEQQLFYLNVYYMKLKLN